MKEKHHKLSTYLLIKQYQAEKDKTSKKAIELDKLIREELKIPDNVDSLSNEIQDKFNMIVQTEKAKNEKFINVTAWIFIILTGLKLLGSGCGLMNIGSASKLLPKIDSLFSENISPFFSFIFQHIILITTISFILSLVMFSTAIGVLYRSNFARKIGIIFLVYEIIRAFISPFLIVYIYPSLHNFNEISKSILDNMYGASIAVSVFVSIIIIVIYGWLVYKFTSPDIKEEFK